MKMKYEFKQQLEAIDKLFDKHMVVASHMIKKKIEMSTRTMSKAMSHIFKNSEEEIIKLKCLRKPRSLHYMRKKDYDVHGYVKCKLYEEIE